MSNTANVGGRRVFCLLPTADTLISGIRFAVLADGRKLSEPIEDPEMVARMTSVPGYELVPESIDPDILDDADEAIERAKSASLEAGRPGSGPQSIDAVRALEEQRTSNVAMADELAATRAKLEAAERKLLATEVPKLTLQVETLTRQLTEAGGAPVALETEITRLRSVNEAIGKELADTKTSLTTITTERDTLMGNLSSARDIIATRDRTITEQEGKLTDLAANLTAANSMIDDLKSQLATATKATPAKTSTAAK